MACGHPEAEAPPTTALWPRVPSALSYIAYSSPCTVSAILGHGRSPSEDHSMAVSALGVGQGRVPSVQMSKNGLRKIRAERKIFPKTCAGGKKTLDECSGWGISGGRDRGSLLDCNVGGGSRSHAEKTWQVTSVTVSCLPDRAVGAINPPVHGPTRRDLRSPKLRSNHQAGIV